MKTLIAGTETGKWYDPRPTLADSHAIGLDQVVVYQTPLTDSNDWKLYNNKYTVSVDSVEHFESVNWLQPESQQYFSKKSEAIKCARKIGRERGFPVYFNS